MLSLFSMKSVSIILTFIYLFSSFIYGAEDSSKKVEEVSTEEEEPKRKMMALDLKSVKNMNVSEVSFIRKSVLEAIFAAQIFEITLGKIDKRVGKNKVWYEIKVSHQKNEKGLSHLQFHLLERPSNLIINYISEDNLIRAKVQYRSRVLAYKLMFGKWFDEKSGKLIEPKVVNLKKSNKSENGEDEFFEDDIEEEEIEEVPLTPDNKKRKVKKKSKRKKKKVSKVTAPKKKKKKVSIQSFSSPDLDLTKNSNVKKEGEARSLEWMSRFDYSFGYQRELALSNVSLADDEELGTETSIQRVVIKASSSMRVKGWVQHFHYGGSFSSVIAEDQYDISPRVNLYGNFNYDLYASYVFLGLNLEFDKLSFVNISSRGEGLKVFNSNIVWVGAGLRYIDQIKGHVISLEADVKKAMIANTNASSNGESVPLDGSKLHLQGRVALYKGWGVGVSYESIALTSVTTQDLDNNHSIVGMYLTYN